MKNIWNQSDSKGPDLSWMSGLSDEEIFRSLRIEGRDSSSKIEERELSAERVLETKLKNYPTTRVMR